MEAKQNIAANDQEMFEPPVEWAREDARDTLLVYLPGFSKEKLKIQITSTKKLRISGERSGVGGTKRFEKEFDMPSNCDANAISANFVEGILYVSNGQENAAQQAPESIKDQATADIASSSRQKKKPISDSGKEAADKMNAESNDFESKKISSSAAAENGADYATHKTQEKDKTKGLVDVGKKSTSAGAVDGKLVENATKRDERGKTVVAGGGETVHGKDICKGATRLESLVMVVKKPNRLINLVVGFLLVVVFALFVKDSIFKSLKGETKRAELFALSNMIWSSRVQSCWSREINSNRKPRGWDTRYDVLKLQEEFPQKGMDVGMEFWKFYFGLPSFLATLVAAIE
ncbi:hypothetical protein FNV43_RR17791 [Rhamnella rubrinervis]|uniref:SHSP domain-containing protein n=1 Tax=Rhamnella rubrinervis TaxID=2594499 RepID=A0A8K0GVZ2_9ROSA|nr:hypothetical protein FNV43_RR17791 [Rhamnella rubrinervis]